MPILVGSISTAKEKTYGTLLAPYLADPHTLFVVSSDFCHWGTRFNYTHYLPPTVQAREDVLTGGQKLSRSGPLPDSNKPIHESIRQLDNHGMDTIAFGKEGKTAGQAHDEFAGYLKATKNTICGRHPIGVLLGAINELQKETRIGDGWDRARLEWVRYEQSSECMTLKDSSVSYASAYVSL